MDLQSLLEQKINALPDGDYKLGLKAVQLHVQAAVRHYQRGKDDDQTLFTDSIYRCNQAFEGSIKEAYRVLAEKAPERKTPSEIEKFLDQGQVLRPRVLSQFKNYRQEWRNPATHDHTLDFDEDEALLAINSVTVFAVVLCDQIDSKIVFKQTVEEEKGDQNKHQYDQKNLFSVIAELTVEFANRYARLDDSSHPARTIVRLDAELAGYLTSRLGDSANVLTEQILANGNIADILIAGSEQKIVIETKLKSSPGGTYYMMERGKLAAYGYLSAGGIQGVVLVVFDVNEGNYQIDDEVKQGNSIQEGLKVVRRV